MRSFRVSWRRFTIRRRGSMRGVRRRSRCSLSPPLPSWVRERAPRTGGRSRARWPASWRPPDWSSSAGWRGGSTAKRTAARSRAEDEPLPSSDAGSTVTTRPRTPSSRAGSARTASWSRSTSRASSRRRGAFLRGIGSSPACAARPSWSKPASEAAPSSPQTSLSRKVATCSPSRARSRPRSRRAPMRC